MPLDPLEKYRQGEPPPLNPNRRDTPLAYPQTRPTPVPEPKPETKPKP